MKTLPIFVSVEWWYSALRGEIKGEEQVPEKYKLNFRHELEASFGHLERYVSGYIEVELRRDLEWWQDVGGISVYVGSTEVKTGVSSLLGVHIWV